MWTHTRRVFAASNVRGQMNQLAAFLDKAQGEADAVVLAGDLSGGGDKRTQYREIYERLGHTHIPTFFVPGPNDAPIDGYLREAFNMEVVQPAIHGVHATFAFAPGHVVVAGMGGTVVDDADTVRREGNELRYPGWEVEYRLKVLHDLKDYPKLFLFVTPPAHNEHPGGSQTLAELVKTFVPHVVVAAGEDFWSGKVGTSTVVVPGALSEGRYAVVDFRDRHAVRAVL